MSSSKFNVTTLSNVDDFLDSLLTFMHESVQHMQEVRHRIGISPTCSSPVPINDEEKKNKLNDITEALNLSIQEEVQRCCPPCNEQEETERGVRQGGGMHEQGETGRVRPPQVGGGVRPSAPSPQNLGRARMMRPGYDMRPPGNLTSYNQQREEDYNNALQSCIPNCASLANASTRNRR